MTTTDVISPDLKTVLRRLKLSRMLDTLPERLTLARQQKMPHQDLLLQVLGLVVLARELVGDVEHLAPVAADHQLPRRVVLPEAALDQLRVRRGAYPLVQRLVPAALCRNPQRSDQTHDHRGSRARRSNLRAGRLRYLSSGLPATVHAVYQ